MLLGARARDQCSLDNNIHHPPPCLCPTPCAYMPIYSLLLSQNESRVAPVERATTLTGNQWFNHVILVNTHSFSEPQLKRPHISAPCVSFKGDTCSFFWAHSFILCYFKNSLTDFNVLTSVFSYCPVLQLCVPPLSETLCFSACLCSDWSAHTRLSQQH